jgi:hypothetical protein
MSKIQHNVLPLKYDYAQYDDSGYLIENLTNVVFDNLDNMPISSLESSVVYGMATVDYHEGIIEVYLNDDCTVKLIFTTIVSLEEVKHE